MPDSLYDVMSKLHLETETKELLAFRPATFRSRMRLRPAVQDVVCDRVQAR